MRNRLLLLWVLLTAGFVVNGCRQSGSAPTEEMAKTLSIKTVSNSLVCPSTAKFMNVSATMRTNGSFWVTGKVDSQNRFGAMLRKEWFCSISNGAPGELKCIGAGFLDGQWIIEPEQPRKVELISYQVVELIDETSLQRTKNNRVKGVVKNVSTHALSSVFISFNLATQEGTLRGTSKATLTSLRLEPGVSCEFTTDVFDLGLTASLGELNAYECHRADQNQPPVGGSKPATPR